MRVFNLGDLPVEMVTEILRKAPDTDILNSGLAFNELAPIAARLLPNVRSLKTGISYEKLEGNIRSQRAELQLPPVLPDKIQRILDIIVPPMTGNVESFHLENEMIRDEISDDLFARLLDLTREAPLREMTLSEIDLERIQMWTLALIARFQLEKIEMEECRLGGDTETKLLKALHSSFMTLTQIDLKGTRQITDLFASRIRECPHLSYFRISDCPLVTTFSAIQLIESTINRRADRLDVHMDNTGFEADRLASYMSSSLFGSAGEWRLQQMSLPFGFQKSALLASHSSRKIVLIFI